MSETGMTTGGGNNDDAEYDRYLLRLNDRFHHVALSEPLFQTDATGLFDIYLDAIPAEERQYHNCKACKDFIDRFGGLVTIDPISGKTKPVMWDLADRMDTSDAAIALRVAVAGANVISPFLSSEAVWGKPVTGVWRHLHLRPPTSVVYRNAVLTAGQKMAERREDFNNVKRALSEFPLPSLDLVVQLLEGDALYRSEKVLGPAKWLRDLKRAIGPTPNRILHNNLIWSAIASAPSGFCHPRSSMVGTLLDDIALGMSFDTAAARFKAKMHPLEYQRPQAAPSRGAIEQAEKVIAQMNAAGSLARRFLRPDELTGHTIWTPTVKAAGPTDGVFGHLKAKGERADQTLDIPARTMTWVKFRDTVLPAADNIEWFAPYSGSLPMTALVTAVNPDAPPIIQWDMPEQRNPVSWYFWHGGSTPQSFGLEAGKYHEVSALTYQPSMWGKADPDTKDHHSKGVMFVVKGAAESRMAGMALFPEILKSELHGVRSVIEAYSKAGKIEGLGEPMVAGIMLQHGNQHQIVTVRVTSGGLRSVYKLDRWD